MLRELIEKGHILAQEPEINAWDQPTWVNGNKHDEFLRWEMKALLYIQQEYRGIPMVSEFKKIIDEDKKCCFLKTLFSLVGILEAFEQIQPKTVNIDYDLIIRNIIEHFNACAIQLKRRHAGRETIIIQDEYDVQDLLHALLKLHFSDVRPEEWTPSYAGNSNRMDFLLKEAHIAIEVKMTRDNLKDSVIFQGMALGLIKRSFDIDYTSRLEGNNYHVQLESSKADSAFMLFPYFKHKLKYDETKNSWIIKR